MVRSTPRVSSYGRFLTQDGVVTYGAKREDGYVEVGIKNHQKKAHAIVARAFLGPKPTPGHSVHHADQRRDNNHIDNLSYATRSEQMHDSYDNNPNRKPMGPALEKAVEGRKRDDTEWVRYPSLNAAAAALNLPNTAGISSVCRGLQKSTGDGYVFRFVDVPDFEGEVWRLVDGHTVSNKGRVKTQLGNITFGSTDGSGYKIVGGSHARIHDLVGRAFLGPPPSTRHTIDHIDSDRANNHIDNLRWATPSEQMTYSHQREDRRTSGPAKSKSICARKRGTDAWVEYPSIRGAAEALQVHASNIQRTFRPESKRHHTGGYEFKLAPVAYLPGEVWVDIQDEWLLE